MANWESVAEEVLKFLKNETDDRDETIILLRKDTEALTFKYYQVMIQKGQLERELDNLRKSEKNSVAPVSLIQEVEDVALRLAKKQLDFLSNLNESQIVEMGKEAMQNHQDVIFSAEIATRMVEALRKRTQ